MGQTEIRVAFVFVYVSLLFVLLVFSLAGNINKLHAAFSLISTLYAIMMLFCVCFACFLVGSSFSSLGTAPVTSVLFVILGLVASVVGYFIAAAAHGRLLSIASVFLQFSVFLPTMINSFTIYSLANT